MSKVDVLILPQPDDTIAKQTAAAAKQLVTPEPFIIKGHEIEY